MKQQRQACRYDGGVVEAYIFCQYDVVSRYNRYPTFQENMVTSNSKV